MRIAVLAAALAAMVWCPAMAEPPSLWTSAEGLRPLVLRRTLFDIPEGKAWLQAGPAVFCNSIHHYKLWKAGSYTGDVSRLAPIFDEEVRAAGLQGVSGNLFERETPPGSLLVGAVVKEFLVRSCGNQTDEGLAFFHADATMAVEWQIYDPQRKEVIARISTTAVAPEVARSREVLDLLMGSAFRMNARAFLAKTETLEFAHQRTEDPEKRATPGDRSTLLVAFAKPGKTPIAQAAGSVVTVFVEGAHGSGFLISPDGYLLTNRHVVGESKLVRVRWSDGFETEGEVVRSDKRRDVALIKSSAHSRQPLFLRPSLAQQGDAVFAVGTPLEEKLAGTVTRGVVSAYRVDGGLNYLQSDAGINHGNSGGPLLDENGAVIAITVSGLFEGDTDIALGINRFIPIGDALEFLGVKAAP